MIANRASQIQELNPSALCAVSLKQCEMVGRTGMVFQKIFAGSKASSLNLLTTTCNQLNFICELSSWSKLLYIMSYKHILCSTLHLML